MQQSTPTFRHNWDRQLSWWKYYILVFKEVIVRSWMPTALIAALLGIVIPMYIYLRPKSESVMTPLVWKIPVWVFTCLAILRVFLSSFFLYRDHYTFAAERENTLKTELQIERDRMQQPDIALVWDWTEDQKQAHSLIGYTDKNIFIHNRSGQCVYNVQIGPINLKQKMTFDLINEITSSDKHVALARWDGTSSLTTEYAHFFCNQHNAQLAFDNKWIFDKVHQRGVNSQLYKIPMTVFYESNGVKWKSDFEFVYDIGDESMFQKKSTQRL